jgi:hypothetical protein
MNVFLKIEAKKCMIVLKSVGINGPSAAERIR